MTCHKWREMYLLEKAEILIAESLVLKGEYNALGAC
jgi:hypothetical protein